MSVTDPAGGPDAATPAMVKQILAPGRTEAHALNPYARVLEDGKVLYPGRRADQMELMG